MEVAGLFGTEGLHAEQASHETKIAQSQAWRLMPTNSAQLLEMACIRVFSCTRFTALLARGPFLP